MWASYRIFLRYVCVNILHDKFCGNTTHRVFRTSEPLNRVSLTPLPVSGLLTAVGGLFSHFITFKWLYDAGDFLWGDGS